MEGKQQHFYSKKITKAIAGALSLVMTLSALPLQTLAATYEVGDSNEMMTSWDAANNNSDASNTFNMTANINMENQTLEVNAGKKYTVNGNNNTLSNVVISESNNVPREEQQAAVIINADVVSDEGSLSASGDVNVVVNGDVKASGAAIVLSASEDADVYVDGNVEATDGAAAVAADNNARVIVNGDVHSENGHTIFSDGGNIQVNGNVEMEHSEDFPLDAINIFDGAKVTVGGDLISNGNAIVTTDSELTVKGDISAENAAMHVENSTVKVNGDITSNGRSDIFDKSDVTVMGDFQVQPNDGVATDDGGLYVTDGSTLYMGDNTMLESDQMHVAGDSKLNAALVDTAKVTVGTPSGDADDTSAFYAYTTTDGSSITDLEAAGKSYSQIIGDVGSITARDDATVEVFGNVGKVTREGNAKVITNKADKNNMQSYLPVPKGDDYKVGNTTAHNIINLCNGYTANSPLYRQYSEMLGLLADVSRDISDKLDLDKAITASLFDYASISTSALSTNIIADIYHNNDNYNAKSIENFESALYVNGYYVDMFKKNLTEAMEKLSSTKSKENQAAQDECDLVMAIFAFINGIEDAASDLGDTISDVVLTAEEKEYLLDIAGDDGTIEGEDLADFLVEFGYCEEETVALTAELMTQMLDGTEKFVELGLIGDSAKNAKTALDWLKYNFTDYSSQMLVLDHILATQPLSAEMFAAAVELRVTMKNKMLGNVDKAIDLLKKGTIGAIEKIAQLDTVAQMFGATGVISGSAEIAEDVQNGAALTIMAPQLLASFVNAIENVKNGNTSEEAVRMVEMTYTMTCDALEEMCDIMTDIGNWSQGEHYGRILKTLRKMKLGQVVDLS